MCSGFTGASYRSVSVRNKKVYKFRDGWVGIIPGVSFALLGGGEGIRFPWALLLILAELHLTNIYYLCAAIPRIKSLERFWYLNFRPAKNNVGKQIALQGDTPSVWRKSWHRNTICQCDTETRMSSSQCSVIWSDNSENVSLQTPDM